MKEAPYQVDAERVSCKANAIRATSRTRRPGWLLHEVDMVKPPPQCQPRLLALALLPLLCSAATALAQPGNASARGPIDVTEYGALCDNAATDDTAAFKAAIAAATARPAGAVIAIPAGRCRLSSTLVLVLAHQTAVVLRGAGQDASELVFTNTNTDGIQVTFSGPDSFLHTPADPAPIFQMTGLSVVYGGSAYNAGVAIHLIGATTRVSGGINPDTTIEDVAIHGTQPGAQGWLHGITAYNLPGALKLRHVNMNMHDSSAPIVPGSTGVAISSTPTNVNAPYNLDDLTILFVDHGIDIGENVQGIYINRLQAIATYDVYASQASLVTGGTGSISLTNSNPVGVSGGVFVNNVNYIWLSNNQFQTAGGAAYDAISLNTSGVVFVHDNSIIGTVGATCACRGIVLTRNRTEVGEDGPSAYDNKLISHNLIAIMSAGIVTDLNVGNVLVDGNAINNTAVPLSLNGSVMHVNTMIDGVLEAPAPPSLPASNPHVPPGR